MPMKNRSFVILTVVVILGMALAVGGGLVYLASNPTSVQAAGFLQAVVDHSKGILVGGVAADSPAAKGGLVRGDIIQEANGKTINTLADFTGLLSGLKAGDKVTLKVVHGDETRTLDVTLGDQNGKPYLGVNPAIEMPFGRFGSAKSGKGAAITEAFNGARITEVVSGSPAEKAGLKVGDVIQSVDGKAIDAKNDLSTIISSYKPGATIKLSLLPKGETNAKEIQVTLAESTTKAGQPYLGVTFQVVPVGGGRLAPKSQPGVPSQPKVSQPGLVVVQIKPGSPAEKAGLKVKDRITEVNGKTVSTADELSSLVKASKVGESLSLTVVRSGESNPLTITAQLAENPDQAGQPYLGVSVSAMGRGFQRGTPATPTPKSSGSNS